MIMTNLRFDVERLGLLMAPQPENSLEVEGVLNPGGTRGPDGQYYIFPRLVGEGNYSRIGLARVKRDAHGRPNDVERLGVALAPQAPYELLGARGGGCEDPRVTYMPFAAVYAMAYTALGPTGAHIALAISRDLRTWTRVGLVDFATEGGTDFNRYANKDGILFPEPVLAPDGQPAIALMHRPIYEEWSGDADAPSVDLLPPDGIKETRPSVWNSYFPLDEATWLSGKGPARCGQHRLVAGPEGEWEAYRIGGGTVPLLRRGGWLTFYHGVKLLPGGGRVYQVGAFLLDRHDPGVILARTEEPVFGPETKHEQVGTVSNVCFPTAIDPRDEGFDVYYGMADSRIGIVHLRATCDERLAAVA